MKSDLLIFTDLDGTLLDFNTYSFDAAKPALTLLKKYNIPVILVSSKTAAELNVVQERLGIGQYPFVVENGSAVYTKKEYFPSLPHYKTDGDFWIYERGTTYTELVRILDEISDKYGYSIRGFHNTGDVEIMRRTGLSRDNVLLARRRSYSIPLFYNRQAEEILRGEVISYNLRLLPGGRFMHLLGQADKGESMKLILQGYRQKFKGKKMKTVALGDSLNDFAMLQAADIAVLVKKHDGTYEDREKMPGVIYSPGIGPSGWNTSIMQIIENRNGL
jgi:mannosyl-3-phosphoglycerate phosphatase